MDIACAGQDLPQGEMYTCRGLALVANWSFDFGV